MHVALCFFYYFLDYESDSGCRPPAPAPSLPPLPLNPDGLDREFMIPLDQVTACILLPHLASSCAQLDDQSSNSQPGVTVNKAWLSLHGNAWPFGLDSVAALIIMKVSVFFTMFSSMLIMMQKVSSGRRRRHPWLLAAPRPSGSSWSNDSTSTPRGSGTSAGYSRLLP